MSFVSVVSVVVVVAHRSRVEVAMLDLDEETERALDAAREKEEEEEERRRRGEEEGGGGGGGVASRRGRVSFMERNFGTREPRTAEEAMGMSAMTCAALVNAPRAELSARRFAKAMEAALGAGEENARARGASRTRYADATRTGIRLAYRAFGESEKRAVIVLHDVGESCGAYCGFGGALMDAGYAVYALDLRGHGESAWSREGRYAPEDLADDVESFIIELDLYVRPVAIVGFGLGGLVAAAMANKNPRLVAAVILVESSPLAPADAYRFFPLQTAAFSSVVEAARALASPIFDAAEEKSSGRERNLKYMCKLAVLSSTTTDRRDGGVREPSLTRWKMDHGFYSNHTAESFWEDIKHLQCHLSLVYGEHSSYVDTSDAKSIVSAAGLAKSARAYRVLDATRRLIEDDPKYFLDVVLTALSHADADMLIANKEPRRPESLGIRPLPKYATIEDAIKALAPRAPPSSDDIEAALARARVDDECESDDDEGKFNNRTMLIQNDPEYFGFVG